MLRFALGVLAGLSMAGWVAAHPAAAHMLAAGEHFAAVALAKIAEAMGGR